MCVMMMLYARDVFSVLLVVFETEREADFFVCARRRMIIGWKNFGTSL